MKMEELNKNQIVLLVLLVSFVTSIATGIVTVTLMDQAPQGVTQTINRIVERTVERVVPGETRIETVVKEVPIIVTEEELIVRAIADASPGIVHLEIENGSTTINQTGFVVSDRGHILTSALAVGVRSDSKRQYDLVLADQTKRSLTPVALPASLAAEFILLEPARNEAGELEKLSGLKPLSLATGVALAGQTVIALSAVGVGDPDAGISVGIVSKVTTGVASSSPIIQAGAIAAQAVGGPLLNTKGEVVGLIKGEKLAYTVAVLKQAIDSIINAPI